LLGVGPTHANYAIHMMVPLALLGLGGGLSFPTLAIIAMSDAQESDAGLASGILNTTGQVGGALGLAVLTTVAGAHTLSLRKGGADAVSALAGGYHFAWLVGAATVVITLGIVLSTLRSQQSVEEAPVEAGIEVA
jgi:MFS family permease